MRSNVAFLVLLMVIMACFSVVQLRPMSLVLLPGNLVLGAVLLAGAVAVALRRPYSFALGLGAALLASVGGLLSMRGWLWTRLPIHPMVGVVVGLYLAFRLVMNRQAEQLQQARRRRPGEGGDSAGEGAP